LDVIEVDPKYRKAGRTIIGFCIYCQYDDSLENSNGFVILEKHGKYVKGSYTLPAEALVCLKERKSAGRKTWKNFRKILLRSRSLSMN
jgi:chromosome segregation protein